MSAWDVPSPPDGEYDVVVLGTGAAGLCAALAASDAGARVGLFEKGVLLGGTTALSSAVVWLPHNPRAAAAGIEDSRREALDYLDSLSHGLIRPEMAESFVDTVPDLIDWLDSRTPLRLDLVPGFPDYHPENPGGKPEGGRSLEPALFSFREIDGWEGHVAGATRALQVSETPTGGGTGVIDPDVQAARSAQRLEGLGRALVGALLKGCLDRGVTPHLRHAATALLTDQGRVSGVRLATPTGASEVRARSVVLATGGFEFDPELARDFLRGPMSHPAGVPTNTGDGLRMAMRLGARLSAMREAWWVPVVELPPGTTTAHAGTHDPDSPHAPVLLLLRERTLPRTVMVNQHGERFTNEAANYNALGGAFHQFDAGSFSYPNDPCWLVFDGGFVERYGGFGFGPGGPAPEWAVRADTLEELAGSIQVPVTTLLATVARFNTLAENGRDVDFGRGDSAYDGWFGDPAQYPTTAATLGPLDEPPFHAVRVHSSTLGTKGGPRTTVDGAVLDIDGGLIPGLYAAGNAMAAPTGMAYGGAGGTLGPALVFGYRAGRHAAAAPAHVATRGAEVSA